MLLSSKGRDPEFSVAVRKDASEKTKKCGASGLMKAVRNCLKDRKEGKPIVTVTKVCLCDNGRELPCNVLSQEYGKTAIAVSDILDRVVVVGTDWSFTGDANSVCVAKLNDLNLDSLKRKELKRLAHKLGMSDFDAKATKKELVAHITTGSSD